MSKSDQRLSQSKKLKEILETSSRLNKNSKRIRDSFDILDGEVRIFKTDNSGDVYQMRMYIKEEQRYVRKTLSTRDKEIAVNNGKKYYIEYKSKIMNGEKIFSITTKQLRDFYLQYEQERTDSGQISVGRLSNIKTHTKHYLDFLGTTLRIQNISKTKFREYRGFRQKQKTDITMNAVMNELITIKKMYDFGRKNGYISNNYEIDYGEIRVRKDETKRDGYTIGEYRQLTGISKFWNTKVKSGQLNYEEEIYYRKLIHYFILCMSNFGFRTNELRLLQWKEVNIHDDETVSITILQENTKVRKQRRVDGNRGIIFKKIKSFSKYTDRNDYVFSHFRENKVLDKTLLYDYYKKLILSVKEKYEDFDTSKTLYSLRHFYITLHLLVGKVDVYSIAHYTGTSLTQIEKHYSHIKDIEVSRKMMKTELKFGKNDEIILEDDLDITEKKRKIINS